MPDEVWAWMVERRWLLSVNSSGDTWSAWPAVLERHPNLRLVMSHLGLPPKVTSTIDPATARQAMRHQTALARFPAVRVKLSGFYALTEPSFDYPHELAWPYAQVLVDDFGVDRLLWASDNTPCLHHQTFPQTLGLLWKVPFLEESDRERIAGGNLLALLGEVTA
jgi:predicted TIM-barrel fold metal-dependent hydrolase